MTGSPSSGGVGEASNKTMNKKAYIAPAMEIMNIETVEMMAASVQMYDDTVNTSVIGNQLGHGRRGTWGNLWDEGE